MEHLNPRVTSLVLGSPIDILTWNTALSRISAWAASHESRYVCICNVHSLVTASTNSGFREVISKADMATPDGAPVAAMLRATAFREQQRINGPDLMWKYLKQAVRGERIYLYGGHPETLRILQTRLKEAFPDLIIAGAHSPPFRPATNEEEEEDIIRINASGAQTVWVSLGCPKQEKWMAERRGKIKAVMIGVGAAFDYHAGTIGVRPYGCRMRGSNGSIVCVPSPEGYGGAT